MYQKDSFTNLEDFFIKDNEFYNQNDVWFDKTMIDIIDNKIIINCIFNPETHTDWQDTRKTNWTSGCISIGTEGMPIINYGTWIVKAKLPNTWPAFWLLADKHLNNDSISTITPEIDVMEIIRGVFQHTVHYKPTSTKYATKSKLTKVKKWDDKFHEFAVDIRNDGYDFYIDGILTGKFRGNQDCITNTKYYLILNNATNPNDIDHEIGFNYPMIISSITILKNKFSS